MMFFLHRSSLVKPFSNTMKDYQPFSETNKYPEKVTIAPFCFKIQNQVTENFHSTEYALKVWIDIQYSCVFRLTMMLFRWNGKDFVNAVAKDSKERRSKFLLFPIKNIQPESIELGHKMYQIPRTYSPPFLTLLSLWSICWKMSA